MSGTGFRFLHCGDLELHRPVGGLDRVPDDLRRPLIAAPLRAAAAVFDTALAERVDFVLIAGGLLDPLRGGPRAIAFVVEQFERLAQRGIAVYWAGGCSDPPEAWPAAVALPSNVHLIPKGSVVEHLATRSGQPLARILGTSSASDKPVSPSLFHAERRDEYTIALVPGLVKESATEKVPIDYWALGGRPERATPESSPHVIHYPGSPQGRLLRDAGRHGCTLVDVDAQGQAHLRFVPTDVVRWQNPRLSVDATIDLDGLEHLLCERARSLVGASPGVLQLVHWTIAGAGPLVESLRWGHDASRLVETLRQTFGHNDPPLWTSGISVEPAEIAPVDEDDRTILGDYLRLLHDFESGQQELPELNRYLDPPHTDRLAASVSLAAISLADDAARRAARLGGDLLRPQLEPADAATETRP